MVDWKSGEGLRRSAGVCALVSVPIGAASNMLFIAAFGDSGLIHAPEKMISRGYEAAQLLRWAAITDMVGFYLLTAPLFIFLFRAFKNRSGGAWLFAAGGLAYCLLGAAGAAILAAAGPPMVEEYASAGAGDRAALVVTFKALNDAVFKGIWLMLEPIPLGVALLGFGRLMSMERKALGIVAMVVGAAALITSAARILGFDPATLDPGGKVMIGGLFAVLVIPLWAGILLLSGGITSGEGSSGPSPTSRSASEE